ncbi:imidazole glycerol phosphate synthase subunit HisH [Pseudomonadota bacterium]
MKLAIIDSGGYNINSIIFAFQRLGIEPILTDNVEKISGADKVILPGVGTANNAMEILRKKNLVDCIKSLKQPTMGICLGMQLLFEKSEEGDEECLGIIKETVKKFPQNTKLTIPHVGWNDTKTNTKNPLLQTVGEDYFYFIHSYYAPIGSYTIASTDYILRFSSMVKKDNFYGCQFHPEKSSKKGEEILRNFLKL